MIFLILSKKNNKISFISDAGVTGREIPTLDSTDNP